MACDIVIGNVEVLHKIESFLNDPAYKEAIENSATFNTRLCIERRLRMPFLDSQTGVAQNHSNLFMSPRQRLPGLVEGQIYSYPSKPWRKKRRQYLMNFMQLRRKEIDPEQDSHTNGSADNTIPCSEDSKDSSGLRDDTPKISQDAWYYDELDMHEMEGFDEPDPDSDYDYEESYKRRKKRGPKIGAAAGLAPKKTKGAGRGRKKVVYDALSDADKPFACELCCARYKTRPGLTYHYTHSHKDKERPPIVDEAETSEGAIASSDGAASPAPPPPTQSPVPPASSSVPEKGTSSTWGQFQDSYLTFLQAPGGNSRRAGRPSNASSQASSSSTSVAAPSTPTPPEEESSTPEPEPERKKAPSEEEDAVSDSEEKGDKSSAPSAYCDFCLGDSSENKKTGHSEELVSCSDCGRSGMNGKINHKKRKGKSSKHVLVAV